MIGSRPTEVADRGDVDAILGALDFRRRDHVRIGAIVVALASGLRRGEVCALRMEDFAVQNGVRVLRVVTLKKAVEVMRNVPVSSAGEALIAKYIKQEHGSEADAKAPLFRTTGTRHPFAVKQLTPKAVLCALRVALRVGGTEGRITPHSFRHGFATGLLRKGADLKTVQELLGHANIWSTQRYLHTTPELMAEAVKRLWE